jgi:hypothetical protein
MLTAMGEPVGGELVVWAASRTVAMHREGERRCKQCHGDGSCPLLVQAHEALVAQDELVRGGPR